jgi:hypothetical protein
VSWLAILPFRVMEFIFWLYLPLFGFIQLNPFGPQFGFVWQKQHFWLMVFPTPPSSLAAERLRPAASAAPVPTGSRCASANGYRRS